MNRSVAAAIAAVALSLAFAHPVPAAADDAIVVDAPDVKKMKTDVQHFNVKEVIGQSIYTNAGRKIGEVEDFVVADGGYLYAVVEVEEDANETLLPLSDGERVVVPWDQLRRADEDSVQDLKR